VCIGWDGLVRGLFLFREQIREESTAVLQQLRMDGLSVQVLTGDRSARVLELEELGDVQIAAELMPEEKLAAIQQIRQQMGAVAMVGDGINDAPALAGADVGLAMACGTDVARQTADVCLLGDDLNAVPWAIQMARRTVATIRTNLFWAFSYNCVGIGIAAFGALNPVIAAIAMAVSSFLVVSNSLRLARD
jgi:Cu+-exporting ATPase